MNEKKQRSQQLSKYDRELKDHRARVERARQQLAPYEVKVNAYQKGPQT